MRGGAAKLRGGLDMGVKGLISLDMGGPSGLDMGGPSGLRPRVLYGVQMPSGANLRGG